MSKKYKMILLKNLVLEVQSNAVSAVDILLKEESDYSKALGYLIMAHNAYLQILVVREQYELDTTEITIFEGSFNKFKIQIDECILNEDENVTWLTDSLDSLRESIQALVRLIDETVSIIK